VHLPFPRRVPIRYVVAFAGLLCAVQLAQGTDAAFSLCSFLFIVVAAFTFNFAGGLTRPSGGYIFFYSLLAVIVGIFWKAVIGERADSNLLQPLLTMEAALGGIVSMCFAVFVSRKLTTKRAILGNIAIENMSQASIGCMITGLFCTAILTLVPRQSIPALSSLSQLNGFLPMAIILGTIYEIRKSGGTRSINLPVLISGGTVFLLNGILGFSKQGMFAPLLCWAVAAGSQRYRLSVRQVIGLTLGTMFIVYYLVPYSQYGRNFKVYASSATESGVELTEWGAFQQNFDTAVFLLGDPGYSRRQSEHADLPGRVDGVPAYFDTPQGFFDRLQMLSVDDALINVTAQRGPLGLWPVVLDVENSVPRFLWPGKPTVAMGNFYAHEIGMIGPEDTTTGVSFSPIGVGFHLARWLGIFVIAPILWIILFSLFDSLCGDVRTSPWGLLAIVAFGHVAPEGGFESVI
jgi:hypothetical protein